MTNDHHRVYQRQPFLPGCLGIILVLLFLSVAAFSQPAPSPARDSAIADSVNRLVIEKMQINAELINKTFEKIESTLTVKQYNQWIGAYQFFVQMMTQVWLEENKKKRK